MIGDKIERGRFLFACLLQTASKAGYIISPLADKKGSFQAQKLGQIEILVGKNDTIFIVKVLSS